MIDIKTETEIQIMREGGRKLGLILHQLMDFAQVGISLMEIETKAQALIKEVGATPSFMTVEDYKWATCLCINDEVVHGTPTNYKLIAGDILTIDIGLIYQGFHADTADSKIIVSQNQQNFTDPDYKNKEKFLSVGKIALEKAIAQAKSGNRVGHISQTIQNIIEGAGYSIVKSLVGHGVGRNLHEDPQIPGFLKGNINTTPILKAGMTIAIEVIYAEGKGAVVYKNQDGWTIATADGSLSAVFEHSIAISNGPALVLTGM
jgi:methionyl aminopeptidase